tara:strand:+ start:350 stop:541 length:192 start_codon:yes stop_codon:yes gene_type:complete
MRRRERETRARERESERERARERERRPRTSGTSGTERPNDRTSERTNAIGVEVVEAPVEDDGC